MTLWTRLVLLSGAFLILVYLESTSASIRDVPYRRVKHQSPSNKKQTTTTTEKPKTPITTKRMSTTKKGGPKPVSSTTTPGSPGQPEGSSGESETTTRMPGGVIINTKAPRPVFDGFNILSMRAYEGNLYYVSQEPGTKIEASAACANLSDRKKTFALVTLNDRREFDYVITHLNRAGAPGPFYINIVIENRDGKDVMIADGVEGRFLFNLDDTNPEGLDTMRNKREILSYVHRRVHRQSAKQKGKKGQPTPAAAATAAVEGGEAAAGAALITVVDTKYPWISNWTGKPEGGECPAACKPTTCTVNTTECTATTVECTIEKKDLCKVVDGGAQCARVCEKCDITSPECYVREPKCVIIKERKCTIGGVDCKVSQDDCVISRPECVSRQPPCNQTANTAPECTLPAKCKTHQAMDCKDVKRPCGVGETEPCTYKQCTPLDICLTPEYCRYNQIVCPPVETFCPPEIVKCPPPTVVCSEPNITCTDPEVYCAPPTVVCTKPLVNCTAPRVNCPNVVTQCPNPTVSCPSPTINCPEPTVYCEQPTIPCPLPPTTVEDCAVECLGKCNCVRIVKSGSEWKREKCECTEPHHFICEGPEMNPDVGVPPGKPPGPPVKPPVKPPVPPVKPPVKPPGPPVKPPGPPGKPPGPPTSPGTPTTPIPPTTPGTPTTPSSSTTKKTSTTTKKPGPTTKPPKKG